MGSMTGHVWMMTLFAREKAKKQTLGVLFYPPLIAQQCQHFQMPHSPLLSQQTTS